MTVPVTGFRVRRYEVEAAAASLPRHPADAHPLQLGYGIKMNAAVPAARHAVEFATSSLIQDEEIIATEVAFDDPLRASVAHDSPVEASVPKFRPSKRELKSTLDEQVDGAVAEWDAYKLAIMQRFASSGTVTVSSNFDVISKEHKARGISHLQQLEDPEKESEEETKILTQQEYVTRLKELKGEIAEAWLNNERVTALRLSIKVAKLLSDTSVPQFYPTLFVLVTDVMDTVGNLVWNRIKQKSEIDQDGNPIELPVNFSADDIRQEAKDTCSNWFLKIGSIKELLPRIYLEIAILRCMHFLQEDLPFSTFQRLSSMIRGLADPVASAYAYIYLSRKGLELVPFETGYLVSGIHDFSTLFYRAISGAFDKKISQSHIQKQSYLTLVEPMFEWTIHCIFKHIKQEEMPNLVVALCGRRSEQHGPKPLSVLVHYLAKQLPATFVGNHAIEISKLIKSSSDISLSQHASYVLLGRKLCECPPPREFRLQVLNDVWKVITKYTSLVEYLAVANVFVDYILQCCSETELIVVLRDIRKHLVPAVVDHKVLSLLESIVLKLITHYVDLTHLLALNSQESFLDIVDLFHGDIRINVYKSILASLSRNNSLVRDAVVRHFAFEAAKALHDSLDSLSSDDDCRQITRLVVRYIQLVDYGRELEHHLDFLADCRATFPNMDFVREEIVHVSNRIAVIALKAIKGFHTRGTMDFVKACITFNEITIPSITSITVRVQLFLETGEVALMNGLLSHTEGLLKSGIMCLQETQLEGANHNEDEVLSILQKLCSFIVVLPGDPELGALYFLRGLLNLLDSKPWLLKSRRKLQMLCGVLLTLSALSQDQLPYHVDQIDSNDSLHFGDPSYQEDMSSFALIVLERIFHVADQETKPLEQGVLLLDASNALSIVYDVAGDMGQKVATLMRRGKSVLPKENSYAVATTRHARSLGLIFK